MQIFSQTRGGGNSFIDFKHAILNPMASFGGLYTLSHFPPLPPLTSLLPLSYADLTKRIFDHLQLDAQELSQALSCYEAFDTPSNPAPTSHLDGNFYLQELYHGHSRSFKDMALQPSPAVSPWSCPGTPAPTRHIPVPFWGFGVSFPLSWQQAGSETVPTQHLTDAGVVPTQGNYPLPDCQIIILITRLPGYK